MKITATLSLLTLLFFATCQPPNPSEETFLKKDFTPSDIDLEQSPKEVTIFGEGTVSTGMYERDMAISPDGNELMYTLSNHKQTIRSLVSISKNGDAWGEPQIVSFSGQYQDLEPCFSVDGQRLYFASNRPMDEDTSRTDFNIWMVQKTEHGWGEAQPLDPIINTPKDEYFPSVSKNHNLYFTATRENGIGREDIFGSEFVNGQYQTPLPLDTNINSETYEFNAYISPDEDLIIFGSFGRKDGLGGGDLYFSKKDEAGNWSKAKNMGEQINSKYVDYSPFIDLPRGNFYFTSERFEPTKERMNTVADLIERSNETLNGMGNIYRVALEELEED